MNDELRRIVWRQVYGRLTKEMEEGLSVLLIDDACRASGANPKQVAAEVDLIRQIIQDAIFGGPHQEPLYDSIKAVILPLVNNDGQRAGRLAEDALADACDASADPWWVGE